MYAQSVHCRWLHDPWLLLNKKCSQKEVPGKCFPIQALEKQARNIDQDIDQKITVWELRSGITKLLSEVGLFLH